MMLLVILIFDDLSIPVLLIKTKTAGFKIFGNAGSISLIYTDASAIRNIQLISSNSPLSLSKAFK